MWAFFNACWFFWICIKPQADQYQKASEIGEVQSIAIHNKSKKLTGEFFTKEYL